MRLFFDADRRRRRLGFRNAGWRRGRWSFARGFTLIELLVVLAIQGILLAAVVTSFTGQLTAHDLQEQITAMHQNARAAMTMVVGEARKAGYDPAGVGFAGITYDPVRLRIAVDHNGDGDLSDSNERVVYFHDATGMVLRRDTGGGGQPVVEDVQSFAVEYLDGAGGSTTATAVIRRLRVTITTRTSKRDPRYPRNGGYRTHTLRSVVTPVNLGLVP
ncbi:MAG: prepilin-type N-terminal cleavage/methylation domain-containing protein [Deltaproteobacteria bacterium]|nr:prepilin-type N-terminal cleavage/methylation domain-containing protein [Deltaproteobacteria bacterium]